VKYYIYIYIPRYICTVFHIYIYIYICVSTCAQKNKKKGHRNGFTTYKKRNSVILVNYQCYANSGTILYSIIFVPHYWLRLLKRLPNRLWKYIDASSFPPSSSSTIDTYYNIVKYAICYNVIRILYAFKI